MLSFIKYKRLVGIETDDEHVNNVVHMREELEYRGMFYWKFDDIMFTGGFISFPCFHLLGDGSTLCYSERRSNRYA